MVERLEAGVNGWLVQAVVGGRRGWQYQAPDGTRGPFHPDTGDRAAVAAAKADWRRWVDAHA